MATYIKYNNKNYNLPSDCSFNIGNSCDTRERRMNDGTGTSFSITTFTRSQVDTYTLSFALSYYEHPQLADELYKFESLVGKNIEFVYCDINFGKLIITDISVSFALDATIGITGLSITINMRDNIVLTGKAEKLNVRFK